MIKVNFLGRLGNNMFEYCLGRILAEQLECGLVSPTIQGFIGTENINSEKGSRDEPAIQLTGHVIDLDAVINNCNNKNIVLSGYFQRYEYYKNHKDKIREWMHIDDYDVGQTNNDIIAHVRLGDDITYFHPEHPYIMPMDYYDKILENVSFDRLYICSEPETIDSEHIKKFDKYDPIILHGDTLEDFRAIKSFNKIIVPQSTFSWWAAFLSNASEIFMPIPLCGDAQGHNSNANSYLSKGTYVKPNEWSDARPDIALFVDDEDRYKYIKQYEDRWSFVNLDDVEES